MNRILPVLAALWLCGGHAAAETLSAKTFTAAFAMAAAAALPDAKVSVAGDLHLETLGAAGGTTTDLRNAYRAYLGDPAHLDAVIQRYVGLLAETARAGTAVSPPDRARIVPVLKPKAWADALVGQRRATPAQQPLIEPFNSELTLVYAEDRPSSVRYLMMGDDVGDRAELHKTALANLRRLLPKIEMRQGADGIFLVTAGGQYEASLLLADDIWSSGRIKVEGDIVVAVPAKDALLVTGSRSQPGLARLRALAAELASGPYALSSKLFVYRGGKFVVLDGK